MIIFVIREKMFTKISRFLLYFYVWWIYYVIFIFIRYVHFERKKRGKKKIRESNKCLFEQKSHIKFVNARNMQWWCSSEIYCGNILKFLFIHFRIFKSAIIRYTNITTSKLWYSNERGEQWQPPWRHVVVVIIFNFNTNDKSILN